MGRVLEISGSPKNVKIAEYVHSAVRQFIDSAWSDYRRGKGLNRYRKTDFAVGIIDGFRSRLQKAVTVSRPIGGPADAVPTVIADRALNRYVAHRYPHLRRVARAGPEPDARIMADGTARGKRLIIAKAIQQRDAFRGRVLTNRRTR
jgi:hypothetical protein